MLNGRWSTGSGLPFSIAWHPLPPRRGFTLLEVLIAIAIVMALVGTMFGFLFDMLSARARALDAAQRQRSAATLIERLENDLLYCTIGDRTFGSGVKGDAAHIRALTRGVAVHLAERGASDPAAQGDLQFAEYRFDAGRQRVEARRGAVGSVEAAQPPFSPLAGSIARVRFRYHDGERWLNEFDSVAARRLPAAVEVAVWFQRASGQDVAAAVPAEGDEDNPAQVGARATPSNAAAFDEYAYARREDRDSAGPPPDRIRVIFIADADTEQDESQEQEEE